MKKIETELTLTVGVQQQKKLLGPMLGTLKPILQIVGFTNDEIKGGIFGNKSKNHY